jgi:transposase-like protein
MKRNKYTAKFKFDRVVESLKKDNISEVARSYGLGANLLSKWRSEFLKNGHQFYNHRPDQELVRLRRKVKQLEQIIGHKEVELNLIKNFSDFYQSQSGK